MAMKRHKFPGLVATRLGPRPRGARREAEREDESVTPRRDFLLGTHVAGQRRFGPDKSSEMMTAECEREKGRKRKREGGSAGPRCPPT